MSPHARGALHDRLFQRAPSPRVDIVLGESGLRGGDAFDRFLQSAGVAGTAIGDAGLVEMDMGLDETRNQQPAVNLNIARAIQIRFTPRTDGSNASVAHADVDQFMVAPGYAPTAQNKIERHRPPYCAASTCPR